MNKPVIILYSPVHLEPWKWSNLDNEGIGGSETCHIVLSEHFGRKLFDNNVISIAPCERVELGPGNVQWLPLDQVDKVLGTNQIWLVFRDPSFFDKELSNKNKYFFVAQDVDYNWSDERLAKVDKYICLCTEHVNYTRKKYPQLEGRIYKSSNGIRSTLIREKIKNNTAIRKPKRIIYSSSPDRGLELILDNFWRITEKHPDVKLDVYYGFNNLKVIAERNQDIRLQKLYLKLIKKQQELKEWVTFHGRINQNQLYNEMLTSSVWFYPSDWPETSCITCMEMQACGVYPILNDFWAQGENTLNGIVLDGVPQKEALCKVSLFKELNTFLSVENELDNQPGFKKYSNRHQLSEDALDSFNWEKISNQYIDWIKNE